MGGAGRGGPPSPVAAGTAGGGRGFAFVRRAAQAAAGPCRTRARRTSRASRWVPRAGRGWGRCRRRAPRGAAGERGAGTLRCGQTKSRRPSRCPGPAGDPGLGRAAASAAAGARRHPLPGHCPRPRLEPPGRLPQSRLAGGRGDTRRPGRRPARQAHGPGGAGVAGGERAPAAVPPARAAGGRCRGAAGSPLSRSAGGAGGRSCCGRGAVPGSSGGDPLQPEPFSRIRCSAATSPPRARPSPAASRRARLTRLGRRGRERRSPGALLASPGAPVLRPGPRPPLPGAAAVPGPSQRRLPDAFFWESHHVFHLGDGFLLALCSSLFSP